MAIGLDSVSIPEFAVYHDPFFDPFSNPFHVLVLSISALMQHCQSCILECWITESQADENLKHGQNFNVGRFSSPW